MRVSSCILVDELARTDALDHITIDAESPGNVDGLAPEMELGDVAILDQAEDRDLLCSAREHDGVWAVGEQDLKIFRFRAIT